MGDRSKSEVRSGSTHFEDRSAQPSFLEEKHIQHDARDDRQTKAPRQHVSHVAGGFALAGFLRRQHGSGPIFVRRIVTIRGGLRVVHVNATRTSTLSSRERPLQIILAHAFKRGMPGAECAVSSGCVLISLALAFRVLTADLLITLIAPTVRIG